MTRSIFKYSLTDGVVYMPKGAEILKVGMQDGIPYLWAMVDPHGEREMRYFTILGTGMLIPEDWKYVGTLFDRPYVWHVFETQEKITADSDDLLTNPPVRNDTHERSAIPTCDA